MIAAGFLPACTALWHRGVYELVHAGWWQDLPGADRWAPAVWLGIPAAAVTFVAIAAAALSRARILIVVLGLASVVHPLLPVALAPLALAVRTWPARRMLAGPAMVAAAIWAVSFYLTPACLDVTRQPIPLTAMAAIWARTIGLAGGVLLVIDLLFRHESRRSQLTAAVMLVAIAVVLGSGRATDAPAFLGAAAAVLWWRVAAGASQVIAWQTTAAGRVGAIALVVLVPLLAAGQGTLSAAGRDDPGTIEAWSALDSAGSPAAIMTTGGRADTATTIWRGGTSDSQQALAVIPPHPDATSRFMATSAVYGWSGQARALSMRGMVVVPRLQGDRSTSPLWRVLNFERCHALTSSWVDISAAAIGGQLAGLFPEAIPNRGALIYLGSTRRLNPRPLDWPTAAEQGFDSTVFDRSSADEAARLDEVMARDRFSSGTFNDARYVTRVHFDRRPMAPDTLAVTLGGIATTAWARLYSEGEAREDRRPMLCRSSVGQPIVGYPGAPAVLDVDLTAPYAIGSGWYGAEQVGDGRFRWSSDADADVLFLAEHAQPLVLRVDAQPGTGSWATAAMQVALNGTPVHCRSGAPPCDWLLPAEAMKTGLNVITLRSATVPAPPPDPRRLGLLVRSAQLARP
jgi:hypothetical protein